MTKKGKKPVFRNDVNYQWQPTDKFSLTGAELNVIHNTLHVVFNDPRVTEPTKWVMLNELYKLTSKLIQKGVEDGIIKEAEKKV